MTEEQQNLQKSRRSLFSLRPFGRRGKKAASGATPAAGSANGSGRSVAKPAMDLWQDEARIPRMRLRVVDLPPLDGPLPEAKPGGHDALRNLLEEVALMRRQVSGLQATQRHPGEEPAQDEVGNRHARADRAGSAFVRTEARMPHSSHADIDEIRARLTALSEALAELDADPPSR